MAVELSRRLRSLFEALSVGRPPTQADLDVLTGLAARAIGAEHHDAVADFLVTTMEATHEGRAASAARLLDLPDAELVAVVRHRLRQHAQQRHPRRRLFRAIRAHVVNAIARPGALGEPAAPLSLLNQGRLSGELVSAATHHLLSTEPSLRRAPSAIAASLMAAYFSGEEQEHHGCSASDDIHIGLDAVVAAAELRAALGPELVRVVKHRHRGLSLSEISKLEGVAVSTAHARVQQAVCRIQDHIRQTGTDTETGRLAMTLLAA